VVNTVKKTCIIRVLYLIGDC